MTKDGDAEEQRRVILGVTKKSESTFVIYTGPSQCGSECTRGYL